MQDVYIKKAWSASYEPVNPVKPVAPVDPVKPVKPVSPVKPVNPVTQKNNNAASSFGMKINRAPYACMHKNTHETITDVYLTQAMIEKHTSASCEASVSSEAGIASETSVSGGPSGTCQRASAQVTSAKRDLPPQC